MTGRRSRRLPLVVVLVLLAVGLVIRPDPIGLAFHLTAQRDPTVAALDAPPRMGQDFHILLVVNDARPDDDDGRFGPLGPLSGARADVVLLVKIGDAIDVLDVPRDLRVTTQASGTVALAFVLHTEGPAGVIEQVRRVTGLPVHHYAEVGFDGVASLIEMAGGLPVQVTNPMRDLVTGIELAPGEHLLSGSAGVQYLRSRRLQEMVDGEWTPVDETRTDRIRQAVGALLAAGTTEGRGWAPIVRLALVAEPDRVLAGWSKYRLVARLAHMDPVALSWHTLPTLELRSLEERISPFAPAHLGGFRWLVLDPAAGEAALDAFASS